MRPDFQNNLIFVKKKVVNKTPDGKWRILLAVTVIEVDRMWDLCRVVGFFFYSQSTVKTCPSAVTKL